MKIFPSLLQKILKAFFIVLIVSSTAYIGFFFLQHLMDEKRTRDAGTFTETADENIIDDNQILEITQVSSDQVHEDTSGAEVTVRAFSPEETAALKALSGQKKMIIDHEALFKQNPDYIGWVCIPGTNISYPVYGCDDNFKYLHHDADGNYLYAGCIYRDAYTGDGALNTVLHGHNMKTGSMFAALNKYLTDSTFFAEHPFVLFYPNGTTDMTIYEIYSTYSISASEAADLSYKSTFSSKSDFANFLSETHEKSLIQTYCAPDTSSNILTLSTCTGRHGSGMRCILHAMKIY